MNVLGPTRHPRLNEGIGLVFLGLGITLALSLVSYHPDDLSWNTATGVVKPQNLIGKFGSHTADLLLQVAGLGAFTLPVLFFVLAWCWLHSDTIKAQWIKIFGSITLMLSVCTAFSLGPQWRPFGSDITAGGLLGTLLADYLLADFNKTGASLITLSAIVLSLYLASKFSLSLVGQWLSGPMGWLHRCYVKWQSWREVRAHRRKEKARARAAAAREQAAQARMERRAQRASTSDPAIAESMPAEVYATAETTTISDETPPWEHAQPVAEPEPEEEDIPIHALEEYTPQPVYSAPAPSAPPVQETAPAERRPQKKARSSFRLPPTTLLNEPQGRPAYDAQELKEIAARIKAKFEEFNVLGSVTQINPGPVVTTFEFKPEAGIKYSRITTLTEDLCLGLQAESILIERIPGKPTVGIEVPNSNREVISLRQVLESDEFANSASPMTMSLGKDISGRIRVAALDSMPHLLIAGSTGSGKSVMLNTMIMSILYKATPNEVRLIMVDPKRVELGIYEGIPHLLTPVITDARKATNALRNAVLEMERRLKLLASQGVRNIDQYNRKVRQMQQTPRSLFDEENNDDAPEELELLPYILILIDELADLMMLERANVEEQVTRLAQMARAVGMHLVLATQRPSVDVITGLIKANFPARISFRVATRVDSRTILDVMGSEHLLGKGDMLFLPPGSSRLTRVHGAYVSENEIERVVSYWKDQASPEYDQSYLIAPPAEDGEDDPDAEFDGAEDPMYQDAVRVVLEMGKASTSTLQRRLRLGYGRAARILDMMQREGIIGPPDGSRPREVLKRPDWLEEVEQQYR